MYYWSKLLGLVCTTHLTYTLWLLPTTQVKKTRPMILLRQSMTAHLPERHQLERLRFESP
jgi:hypothetical protein